jgi:hypothetical protein
MHKLPLALLVAALLASPVSADVVVSNLDKTPVSTAGIVNFGDAVFTSIALPFTTDSSGATLDKVTLLMGNGSPTGSFSLSLYSNAGGGFPGSLLVNLSGDDTPIVAGQYDYIPSSSFTLEASTSYWVVAEPITGTVIWMTTTDTSETGAPGWSLGDSFSQRQVIFGNDGGWVSATVPTQMAVFASAIPEASSWALMGLTGAVSCGVAIIGRARRRFAIADLLEPTEGAA